MAKKSSESASVPNQRKQRGNGEGSISLRKDGRYEVAVIDPATGNRKRTYAKTEAEAKRVLRRMNGKADAGAPVLDAGATVKVYAELWLKDRAGRRRRESTVREYGYRLNQYVIPTLGRMRLREVTVVDVEDLLDALVAKGLARGTVAAIRNALAAMLQDAVRARQLSVNVARSAQMPEVGASDHKRVEIPTDAQVRALIAKCRGTELAAVVAVCVGTGARIGEVLAMQWSDVELELGLWRVARTLTRGLDGSTQIGLRTKTGKDREVAITPEVVSALKAQRKVVAAERMRSAYWQDHDLVFPTNIGTAQDPHNVRRALKPLATAAGFPGSFHALRHWYASMAVTLAPDVTVSKLLGHARTSTTTDLYSHLRATDSARIAVAVSVAVNEGK
ncbi:MAG: site-specific integrase [Candidatus Nanopelagicales bacterium]